MKQYISRFLKTVAGTFLTFPIIYILGAATLFDIPIQNCVKILFSPFYYLVTFFAVLVGYGLWEMRRWSWYTFIALQFVLVYTNALLVFSFGETHHKVLAFLMSVILQLVLILRVSREIRVPYFFPKIRWWESNPRYRLAVPVSILRRSGETFDGEILDVSVAGCFVKNRNDFEADESIKLRFKMFGSEIECDGCIVWNAVSTVTHPKGIGVKFNSLNKSQKRTLKVVTKRLKEMAILYRKSRYLMSQEDFIKHLESIEKRAIPQR